MTNDLQNRRTSSKHSWLSVELSLVKMVF